ncbi:MAG: hypothetical protein M1130_00340 [Actinobacteria bacterium]|nr:hypothetical protein [Actinomycetota bacterium]
MVKKKKKDKNSTADPSLLVVEPTIQYLGGKNTDPMPHTYSIKSPEKS